jgi:cell division initiation protein
MLITPLDIQQRQFKTVKLGGLDKDDVQAFLNKLCKDYEQLFAENRKLKDQILRLQKQMKDYIELERTLKETLVSAQKTSGEIRINAEKEAELIIREAELNGEKILDEARIEVRNLMAEIRQLKTAKRKLKIELKNILDTFYAMLREDIKDDGRA